MFYLSVIESFPASGKMGQGQVTEERKKKIPVWLCCLKEYSKIGDIALLSQVTVVTLRHCDEMGLIKPALVDPLTGYRYYSVDQLPELNRILALKDLGLSRDQIAEILTYDLALNQLLEMLELKRAEIEQYLRIEQACLGRIEARLRQIDLEEKNTRKLRFCDQNGPAMLAAFCRVSITTNDQVPVYLGSAYDHIYDYIHKPGAKEAGACLSI